MFRQILQGDWGGVDSALLLLYTVGILLCVLAGGYILYAFWQIRQARGSDSQAAHVVENTAVLFLLCFLISYVLFYYNLFFCRYYIGASWLVVTAGVALWLAYLLMRNKKTIAEIPDLEALRRMRQMVEVLENVNKFGWWSLDLSTNKIEWSQGMYGIYHSERIPELATLDALVHPDDRAMVLKNRELAQAGIIHNPTQYRIVVQGMTRHLRATLHCDDKREKLFGSVMDITHEIVNKQAGNLRAAILEGELLEHISQAELQKIKEAMIWKS